MATKKKVPAKKAVEIEKTLKTVLVLSETGFPEYFCSVEEAVDSFIEEGEVIEDIENYAFFTILNGEIVPVKNLKVVAQKATVMYNV